MYAEWAALGVAGNKALVFRLSQQDDQGCETACDGGCAYARTWMQGEGSGLEITYAAADEDDVHDLGDGVLNTASSPLMVLVGAAVIVLCVALAFAVKFYRGGASRFAKAVAGKKHGNVKMTANPMSGRALSADLAGPGNDML
jgi:hypothetical protein